jgi:multiple sugar transport system permease protein
VNPGSGLIGWAALVWRNRVFYLFLLPMFALVTVFGVFPIGMSIQMSLTDSGTSLSGNPAYVWLDNYRKIFSDPYFIDSLRTTVGFTLAIVPMSIALSLCIALLLSGRTVRRGSVFFRLAVFIPVVAPIMATSVIWKWMYNADFGAVNELLALLGIPDFAGLARPGTALLSLGIFEVWKHVGLYTVIFATNMQLIDREMYEAAYLEGANYPQRTWYITIPELRPALSLNLVYATIQFLKTFTSALVMTRGGPNFATNFVSHYAYTRFRIAEYGEATAMGTVLFGIVILIALLARRLTSSTERIGV